MTKIPAAGYKDSHRWPLVHARRERLRLRYRQARLHVRKYGLRQTKWHSVEASGLHEAIKLGSRSPAMPTSPRRPAKKGGSVTKPKAAKVKPWKPHPEKTALDKWECGHT